MPERPRVADFARLIEALHREGVQFVVIRGVAARFYGSARVTDDFDILYDRTPDNLERVVRALAPLRPTLRGAPDDLPFLFDARTLRSGLNFTFATVAGPIDILGEISGVGSYRDVVGSAVEAEVYGFPTKFLSLGLLIRAKEAAGRRQDLAILPELRALQKGAAGPPPSADSNAG